MPNLNVDISYFEHPKTRRLTSKLGPDADVLPIRLWAYCGRVHAKDGKLDGYSKAEVEAVVGWRGVEGAMVDAFVDVGFLHATKKGFQVHDWKDHEGHLISYSVRGRNAAKARWDKEKGSGDESCNKHAPSNAPTNQPNPPTKPTRPSRPDQASPTAPANGSGSGSGLKSGGDGGGSARLFDSDAARQLEVQGLLAQAGVNATMQQRLMHNRTITPTLIRRHLDDIEGDKSIDRPAAVLVSRLQKKVS